ncbi:MAG: hypothetical protein HC880_01735 [Bacteroidia bacterium]|nr:hypothetical protein [Bacteroidia bacterium]
MKVTIGFFILFICGLPLLTQDECNVQEYTNKGIKTLSEEGGYTFLKSYPVSGQQGKTYSYIFSQGTHYMIALANHKTDAEGVFIRIYDAEKHEIVSSLVSGKYYPAVAFTCKRTGIYQLQFAFENTSKYCAAGVLGMKR